MRILGTAIPQLEDGADHPKQIKREAIYLLTPLCLMIYI